jgi:hypothetical protein
LEKGKPPVKVREFSKSRLNGKAAIGIRSQGSKGI